MSRRRLDIRRRELVRLQTTARVYLSHRERDVRDLALAVDGYVRADLLALENARPEPEEPTPPAHVDGFSEDEPDDDLIRLGSDFQ